MSIFRGFNIDYPSYSVITPQTGNHFDVRCLTVAEADELKHSILTPNKSATIINDIIWKTIKNKPEHIKTFQDFLENTTLNDRSALVYGIFHSTFGSDREFSVMCFSCGIQQNIRVDISKTFSMKPYPKSEGFKKSYEISKAVEGQKDSDLEKLYQEEDTHHIEDEEGKSPHLVSEIVNIPKQKKSREEEKKSKMEGILTRTIKVELPISKIFAFVHQPTIQDESSLLNSIPFTDTRHIENVLQTLAIQKFEYDEGGKTLVVDEQEDILKGFNSLPIDDKDKIFDIYQEEFGQYGIELRSKWNCRECGSSNELDINIVNQFFRMVQVS